MNECQHKLNIIEYKCVYERQHNTMSVIVYKRIYE